MEKEKNNDILYMEISQMMKLFFGDVLNILSTRFPHVRGDNSSNEHQFLCLRSKILRAGNDKIRKDLLDIINDYDVKKRRETSIQTVMVGQKVK